MNINSILKVNKNQFYFILHIYIYIFLSKVQNFGDNLTRDGRRNRWEVIALRADSRIIHSRYFVTAHVIVVKSKNLDTFVLLWDAISFYRTLRDFLLLREKTNLLAVSAKIFSSSLHYSHFFYYHYYYSRWTSILKW